jgi:hypothetical protein
MQSRREDTSGHSGRQVSRDAHDQRQTSFGSPIEGFRTTSGPLAEQGVRVGIYKGHAGPTDARTGTRSGEHFFSAESTGGGETDSHTITGDFSHLEVGKRYAFGQNYLPSEYSDSAHHDLPGAPITEMNKNRPVPGERPKIGAVRTGDTSGGMVGHVVGSAGKNLVMSAEATGGGETDSHMFDFPHDKNLPRTFAGQRMAMVPNQNGKGHELQVFNPKSHGHLPGAPLED